MYGRVNLAYDNKFRNMLHEKNMYQISNFLVHKDSTHQYRPVKNTFMIFFKSDTIVEAIYEIPTFPTVKKVQFC